MKPNHIEKIAPETVIDPPWIYDDLLTERPDVIHEMLTLADVSTPAMLLDLYEGYTIKEFIKEIYS